MSLPFIGFIVLGVPFLSLIPITLIVSAIWRKEMVDYIRYRKIFGLDYKVIVVFTCILLALYFVRVRELVYGEGWFPQIEYQGRYFREMGESAGIRVFNPSGGERNHSLILGVVSLFRRKPLEVYVNNNPVKSYDVPGDRLYVANITNLMLRSGENKIEFRSPRGCDVISKVIENSSDMRCLSFAFQEIKINRHTISHSNKNKVG